MIGIFDSGVGGLTVLRAIREYLPSADVVYFGDTKNAPYGERSREELSALTVAGIKLLQDHAADKIVSACNSVSASLAVSLFDAFDIAPSHLIEMVGPTVSALRRTEARIAVCATPATINSGIYADAFRMIGKDIKSIAIPKLAGAIEFGAQDEEIERIVSDAFEDKDLDVLVLGCTHYPLAMSAFSKALPDVKLFDPADAVALRAKKQFWPQEAAEGKTRFLISKDSEHFRALASKMFGDSPVEVV